MLAITIDQRRSRTSVDAVPALLEDLDTYSLVRAFERTAGDEVQGLTDDASTAVDLVVDVASRRDWWVGVGVGPVDEPIPRSVRASRGPALVSARHAVERAHRQTVGIALEGPDARHAETALLALVSIVADRTPEGREAVDAMAGVTTQKEAATTLGISAQAMSRRLRVARWEDERRMRDLAVHLIEQIDRRA